MDHFILELFCHLIKCFFLKEYFFLIFPHFFSYLSSLRSSGQDKSISIEFLSDGEDEQSRDEAGVKHSILPGGGGMAICAHTCSSVKVEELSDVNHRNVSIGVSKVQSQKDLVPCPRQHVKMVDVGSESYYQYHTENVASCISFPENISNSHSWQEYENDVQISTNKSSRLKFSGKKVSKQLCVQQRLDYDFSQSSSFATALKPINQGSSVPHADISDFFTKRPKQTNNMKSDWEVHPPERRGSFGFSTSKYRRHHSQPESGQFRKDAESSYSSYDKNDEENKKIVARQRYQRRSVSYGSANEVEEVIELWNHDDDFYVSCQDQILPPVWIFFSFFF